MGLDEKDIEFLDSYIDGIDHIEDVKSFLKLFIEFLKNP